MLPFELSRSLEDIPPNEVPDDEMLVGFSFGQFTGTGGKTPYDYIAGEDGIRPGDFNKKTPFGVTKVDLAYGIKQHHCIPSIAIWEKGKWFYKLDQKLKDSISVINKSEEWDAWVVSGEGTPGNYLLRIYIVPDAISQYETPDHPFYWTTEEVMRGNSKGGALTTPGVHYGGGGYGFQQPKPATPAPPAAPALPIGIHFRCPGCGHWFPSETKLAGHSTHCCPGSANWNDQEGADWIIECECCPTFDMTASCKEGFPRKPKPKAPEEPTGTSSGSTNGETALKAP